MLSTRKESGSISVEIRKMMPMDTNDTSVIPVWSIFVWCSFPSQQVSVFPPYLQRFRRLCGVGRGTYAYVFGSFVWTWSSNKVLLRGSNTDVQKSLVWSHLLFQNKHVVVFGHISSLKSDWGAGWQFEIEFAVLLDNQPNVMFDMVWYYTICCRISSFFLEFLFWETVGWSCENTCNSARGESMTL
jgi:hypothetical protein